MVLKISLSNQCCTEGGENERLRLWFYCAKEIELANEWACSDNNDGYANEYELDLNCLKVLDLSDKKYHILNRIALLLKNRIPESLNQNDEQTREYW